MENGNKPTGNKVFFGVLFALCPLFLVVSYQMFGRLDDMAALSEVTYYFQVSGIVACVFAAVMSVMAAVDALKAEDAKGKIFRRSWFWRWLVYGLFVCLVVTCWFEQPKPRYVFRVLLLLLFDFGLFFTLLYPGKDGIEKILRTKLMRVFDVAGFNIILTLALLEIGLRVVAMFSSHQALIPPNLRSEKKLRLSRREKGSLHIGFPMNSLGFVDKEFAVAKPESTYRILGVGDSFGIAAVPYKYNSLTVLEDMLNEDDKKPYVEIMNASVGGASPYEYYELIAEFLPTYHVDYTILYFFTGNDIEGTANNRLSTPYLHRNFYYSYFIPPRIYSIIRCKLRTGKSVGDIGTAPPQTDVPSDDDDNEDPNAGFGRETYLEIEYIRQMYCKKPGLDEKVEKRYRNTKGLLADMFDATRKKILVVLIPDEYQVNDKLWNDIMTEYKLDEADYDRDRPQKELSAFFEANEIEYLDLLPALRHMEKTVGRTYKYQDTHWNKRGNRLAATKILQKLERIDKTIQKKLKKQP